MDETDKTPHEEIVRTACASHCGGKCLLKVHVMDGAITRIETDDGDEEPQLRACLRCRAYRQRVYDTGRVKFPMRRIAERGEGRFERISWDEALDAVVGELNRVRNGYGPSSVLYLRGGGDTAVLHRSELIEKLLMMTGGHTRQWGYQSFDGGLYSSYATYGTVCTLGDSDVLLNSRLIIMWGWNPTNSINRTNTSWYLMRAKESGARIICIDPRYTNTAAVLADQWIPIVPGTDAAALIAMAYTIIEEGLLDKAFVSTYTIGFEQFKDYVLGVEDGIPKTPLWAQDITGVPAEGIWNMAKDYATIKPAALIAGHAPGRTAYGEQYHRATEVLAAMTGNTGIEGGWAGRLHEGMSRFGGFDFKLRDIAAKQENPVEFGAPAQKDSLPLEAGWASTARIHYTEVADAIIRGKAGGFPADLKMLLVMGTNPINQYPNTNKLVEAFKKLEFIVVAEQVMTATAKFADILLPVSTFMERNDIVAGGATPVYGHVNKVIEALGESKSPLEICCGLAERMDVSIFSDKTEEEWLRELVKDSYIPDYDTFKEKAVYRVKFGKPRVAFRAQIEDPKNHPFPTPSGKIEIYSQKLADIGNPKIPPVPKYVEAWEGRKDPLTAKYPLQLITTHFKRRAHSQFERVPWLRELLPQAISINPVDASARGIDDGDMVVVFNDRGKVIIPATVTERIMPGVVDMPQGAWYCPDARGVDRGGCANVLTKDARSPGGAFCSNTCLVEIQRAPEDSSCS